MSVNEEQSKEISRASVEQLVRHITVSGSFLSYYFRFKIVQFGDVLLAFLRVSAFVVNDGAESQRAAVAAEERRSFSLPPIQR